MKDIYVYDNTNVLINKLNIKNSQELDQVEGNMVSLLMGDIIVHPFKIESVFDIKTIHKMLFSDLYEWAGEIRKINIYKQEQVLDGLSVNYSDYKNIESDLNNLDRYFKSIKWSELKHKTIIKEVVKVISKLWRVHCFREGNTRTATVFLYLLMKQIKLKVNMDFIGKHSKYFRNALVLASIDQYSEYEHLEAILMDSISLKKTINGEEKYQTIRGYDLDKYEYNYHHIKED